MTLTSVIGKFVFSEGVSLVDAKAVRDTILAAWHSGNKDVISVLRSWENRASKIPFELVLNTR